MARLSDGPTPRPHDLLRLRAGAVDGVAGAPPWALTALMQTPWVVVRRATAPHGLVAVGVRGRARSHRWATTVPRAGVAQLVTPESLRDVRPATVRDLPALRALAGLRTVLNRTGLGWGPAGSVGFELCTGACSVTTTSDLDLVIRAGEVNQSVMHRLSALHAWLSTAPARVDCQVETPFGAVVLAELAAHRPRLLVRDLTGPRLVPTEHLVR
jgi:phosphoribosyl-dephospho-CoA transferase